VNEEKKHKKAVVLMREFVVAARTSLPWNWKWLDSWPTF